LYSGSLRGRAAASATLRVHEASEARSVSIMNARKELWKVSIVEGCGMEKYPGLSDVQKR